MTTAVSATLIDPHNHKIWIDLDNSPHVPFFVPIIEELKQNGFNIFLTARDNAQVVELLNYHHLDCKHYGHHFGKNKLVKVVGTGLRALRLAPLILRQKPDLAVSHGSRTQMLLSTMLGIPTITIADYEHANMGIRPNWLMVPEVLEGVVRFDRNRTLMYPGIKEDVYVPRFRPTAGIREDLGIAGNEIMVTIRPPASDAHYHNPLSDQLFRCAVEFLSLSENVRMVMLPRNSGQADSLRTRWPGLFANGKIIIPKHIVDGLNLIWFSDLVISGGGTMNREAAALGVPVYSIFLGKQAAVDRYLSASGRLNLVQNESDVRKIQLVRRIPPSNPIFGERAALAKIVENIINTVELSCHTRQTQTVL